MRPRSLMIVLAAVAALLLARIPLLAHRAFDPDELEHCHAAWLWFKGMLPYKDFFEHHTPWYYYALRPSFNWFDVDASFDSARHFLLFGRWLSFALMILSVVLVYRIGRRWADRGVALLAALLLVSQPFFLQKTIEIRPDVPALAFFLGGLSLLLRGIEGGEAAPKLRWFIAGGLCVGAAVMCTQKALFVIPGMAAGLAIWAFAAEPKAGARARLVAVLLFGASLLAPAVLTWAAFALQHAGSQFITNNFLLNARWKRVVTERLVGLLATSGPIIGLAALGAGLSLRDTLRTGQRRYDDLLLICTVVGLFAGVAVLPSAHRQYYLLPLPILCLFAAKGLLFLIDLVSRRGRAWRAGFIAFAAVGLAVLPSIALYRVFKERNDAQLAALRTVFKSTGPTDVVMDGWQGMGVFRPHAFHYYFLHEETRAMLPPAQLDAFLDALESGQIKPKLIAMDENLRALGPRFRAIVRRNYATGDGFFYFPRRQP